MRRFIWVVVAGLCCVNPVRSPATDLTLEELQAAVADQLTSLRSLYLAYTITDPESLGGRSHDYIWGHDESRVLYRAIYSDSTVGFWTSHDGRQAYSVGYSDEREPAALEIKDSVPGDLYVSIKPTKLLGLHVASGAGSLAEAIRSPSARLELAEDPAVARVSVTGFTSNPDPAQLGLTIEFDGGHDYAARRIDYHAEQNPGWKFAYRVDRFERVRDAASGQDRWFPMQGAYIQDTPEYGYQEFSIVVTEVRINENLDEKTFVPEIPNGVSVTDNTQNGRGRFYMTGGYRESDTHLNEVTKDALGQLEKAGRWRLFLIGNLLIALAVIGGGLWWIGKRQRSK
jgi:hypothetical protein